jgi:hypothetical protein
MTNCLNSTLQMRNLKNLVEPNKIPNNYEKLNSPKEVTFEEKLEFKKMRTKTKSVSNPNFFDETKNQLNKSRDFSMNSTAIASTFGDNHNMTNTKLIKEIHKYRYI